MKRNFINWLLLIPFVLAGCAIEESDYEKRREQEDEQIKAFLDDHNISATRDATGIYYQSLTDNPGHDAVERGDVLAVFYDMKTLEGTPVGKTADSLAPAYFRHDYLSVIPPGIDYCVRLMKEGQKFRFFMPASMAYGLYGKAEDLSSAAAFMIDLELIEIRSEAEMHQIEINAIQQYIQDHEMEDVLTMASGLRYSLLEAGSGDSPVGGSEVTFHFIRRYLDGSIIERTEVGKPVTVSLNSGVVAGLKEGLLYMKEGGKSLLIMPSKLAFGKSVQVLPMDLRQQLIDDGIVFTKALPYSPLIYEVELISVNN